MVIAGSGSSDGVCDKSPDRISPVSDALCKYFWYSLRVNTQQMKYQVERLASGPVSRLALPVKKPTKKAMPARWPSRIEGAMVQPIGRL
jgi:hypothetical protein